MNRIPVTEAAKLAGITREQARYWSTLLDLEVKKEGRVSYLPAGSESLLLAMAKAVSSGSSPSVAANEVKSVHALPIESPAPICDNTAEKIADLEKAILLLVESNRAILAENRKMASIIERQSTRLDVIANRLPAPPPEPAQPSKKTVVKVPLLKRIWLELFNPTALRATH